MNDQRRLLCLGAAGLLACAPVRVSAQPARTLRIIVPFAPGGPIDLTVRLLAEKARESLGPIVIENRPGAGGGIGVAALARSAPDGQTIGVAAVAMHAINPWLFSRLSYDPIRDFAPITQMVRIPNVLVINTEVAQRLRIDSLRDFIAYARANPAKLNYASGGNGSAGHLAGEMFKQRAGFFAVHIPYAGGGPAQIALLSGQVDFSLDNLATAAPNIRAGRIRALAVTTAERSPLLPEVPAFGEVYPGFEIDTWWGLTAPAGTPREVLARLNEVFVAALKSPDIRTRFAQLMAEPVATTPEQFAALIQRELQRYEKVVKASGAQVD
ncbi:MAG: tripartite tricarboxylate transporter substrate binding protein [Burkholderiales bacterium]|nr:tripartite tricarboxylate transporter substrate binding protein [Burkholderiales bacterium]